MYWTVVAKGGLSTRDLRAGTESHLRPVGDHGDTVRLVGTFAFTGRLSRSVLSPLNAADSPRAFAHTWMCRFLWRAPRPVEWFVKC
jgi:hypothetical protein